MITGLHFGNLLDVPGGAPVALMLWAVLGGAALVDARTGRIPNRLLLSGAGLFAAALLLLAPPVFLLLRLMHALLIGGLIWMVNEVWHRLRGHDALGRGDAKWSALAALGFGYVPVLWAWGLAAWFGLGWLAFRRWQGRPARQVHFAPFLLAGLIAAKLLAP